MTVETTPWCYLSSYIQNSGNGSVSNPTNALGNNSQTASTQSSSFAALLEYYFSSTNIPDGSEIQSVQIEIRTKGDFQFSSVEYGKLVLGAPNGDLVNESQWLERAVYYDRNGDYYYRLDMDPSGLVITNLSTSTVEDTSSESWGLYQTSPQYLNDPAAWNAGMFVLIGMISAADSGDTSHLYRCRARVTYEAPSGPSIKDGGVWKQTEPFIRDGGVWKASTPEVKDNGVWYPPS